MGRRRNKKLKSPGEITEMTPEQVLEFEKCTFDPIHFIKTYCKVKHPHRGSVPFLLWPFQERMITAYQEHRFNIVLASRQVGKSTVSAIYLLWFAIFHPDKTVLIASNKNKGAMEMISRIRYAYEELPHWIKPGVKDDEWNKHTVGFDNGSKIDSTATSEDAGRGESISLLFLDEFAHVKRNIQDPFWMAISPTLSTGGSCIMSSTPNGDMDKFSQFWRNAEVGIVSHQGDAEDKNSSDIKFNPIRVRWDEPPGRDEAFKQAEIAQNGQQYWDQEFDCQFLSSDALLIDSMTLQHLTKNTNDKYIIKNEVTFWEDVKRESTYLIGVDPSAGVGKDFSVIEVFHFPSMVQVAEYRSNTMSPPVIYSKLKYIIALLEKQNCTIYFSIENNGVGAGLISLFQNDENPPDNAEFVCDNGAKTYGMNTNPKTKMKGCVTLKQIVESGRITFKSKILINELKTFVRKGMSYEAQYGSSDDCVSSVLIVLRILEEIAMYEDAAFEKLYTYDAGDYNDPDEFDEYDEPIPFTMGNDDDFSGYEEI